MATRPEGCRDETPTQLPRMACIAAVVAAANGFPAGYLIDAGLAVVAAVLAALLIRRGSRPVGGKSVP
jgi:hypothetical protein